MTKSTLFQIALVLGLIAVSFANRSPVASVEELPQGWELSEQQVDQEEIVSFTVLLKQSNLKKLDQLFQEVSDPDSPNYRRYLTLEQADALLKPSQRAYEALDAWISQYSGVEVEEFADAVEISAPVSIVQEMLHTEMKYYQHSESSKSILRASGQVSVPSELSEHVDFVVGITEFFKKSAVKADLSYKTQEKRRDGPDVIVTPQVLKKYYKVPENLKVTNPKNLQAIAAFDDEFSLGALRQFESTFNLQNVNITRFQLSDSNSDEVESNLDTQYISAIAQGANTWFVKIKRGYWILQFITEATKQLPRIPYVISISYGWSELDQCTVASSSCSTLGYDSKQYVTRTNTGFQKLGVMGTSVLVADGDSGATNGNWLCGFTAVFPGSSPFVTSVGASRFVTNKYGDVIKEVAVTKEALGWSTGGGFSSFQQAPDYQKQAVSSWYALAQKTGVLPDPSGFSTQFRGYPDVTFNGHHFQVFSSNGGVDQCPCTQASVDGTSASSPSFAGLVTLLNDAVMNNGKQPLGFLNPMLYKMATRNPSTFNDLVEGDNGDGCSNKYVAQKGWDPVTGLGSPNFGAILAYVLKL